MPQNIAIGCKDGLKITDLIIIAVDLCNELCAETDGSLWRVKKVDLGLPEVDVDRGFHGMPHEDLQAHIEVRVVQLSDGFLDEDIHVGESFVLPCIIRSLRESDLDLGVGEIDVRHTILWDVDGAEDMQTCEVPRRASEIRVALCASRSLWNTSRTRMMCRIEDQHDISLR